MPTDEQELQAIAGEIAALESGIVIITRKIFGSDTNARLAIQQDMLRLARQSEKNTRVKGPFSEAFQAQLNSLGYRIGPESDSLGDG